MAGRAGTIAAWSLIKQGAIGTAIVSWKFWINSIILDNLFFLQGISLAFVFKFTVSDPQYRRITEFYKAYDAQLAKEEAEEDK